MKSIKSILTLISIRVLQAAVIPEVLDGRSQVLFRNIAIPIGDLVTEKHNVPYPLYVRPSLPPDKFLDTPIRALVINKAELMEEQRQRVGE